MIAALDNEGELRVWKLVADSQGNSREAADVSKPDAIGRLE